MFDNGWERVVDGIAAVTGCDRDALVALIGHPPTPNSVDQASLLDRIGAAERLAQAVQAVQVHDLAAFNTTYLASGDKAPLEAVRDPQLPAASRMAVIEVACELQVAPVTAGLRITNATRAVDDHPELLGLVGTGRVSMAGLSRVLEKTIDLDSDTQHTVAAALAAEAERRVLTPGELGRAATRRVLAADPDAAARRVARARRNRSVRLADPVDGTAGIYAVLRAEEAVAIFTGLDKTARGMRAHGDDRSLDTLRADLFVDHLTGRPMTRLPAAPNTGSGTGGGSGDSGDSGVSGGEAAGVPRTWRRYHGVAPAFDQHPPPLFPDPDPAPDDPVWDSYLPPPDPRPDPGRLRLVRDPDPSDPDETWRHRLDVEVQVVVSLATVLGLDDAPGMLRGYGALPAATIREIVEVAEATGATTRLRGLFCDPVDGRLLAMESAAKLFTGGLRQFCAWRDQTDRLTGSRLSDIDHVHPRHQHGPTTAGNGQGLGILTNRVIKQHPDVTVHTLPPAQRGDGLDRYRAHAPDIAWTLPSGHTHTRTPPPVLGPGSDPADEPHTGSAVEAHLFELVYAATG